MTNLPAFFMPVLTEEGYVQVAVSESEDFKIPATAAQFPHKLNDVLERMGKVAEQQAQHQSAGAAPFGNYATAEMPPVDDATLDMEKLLWNTNMHQLARQIKNRRDTIWIYVLQNTTRPLIMQHRKFDVVAGNPPWLSYRYIADATYQNDVRQLARDYALVAANERKLTTQIELSTIFFAHASAVYLKPDGVVAFVMPRSVLTGAKQHAGFQQMGFTRVLDCKDVAPLFNVETCVLLRRAADIHAGDIPTVAYAGKLPAHECTLATARAHLTERAATTSFAQVAEIASPYYHPRFKQGATLVPRNLVFVTSAQPNLAPGELAHSPIMKTDPEVDNFAKATWKGIQHQGYIHDEFLYSSILGRDLVPFGVRHFYAVALPFTVKGGKFTPMTPAAMRDSIKFIDSAEGWFEPVEKLWAQLKKETTKETLGQWLNFQNKITDQSAVPGYVVVYNATGSNIAASVVDTHHLPIAGGVKPQGFVVEHEMYWFRSFQPEEAHFLAALLNAPCVDAAIKMYQPRGLYGPRHIQRRPLEVCAIPEFDPRNADHARLAALSMAAHSAVAGVDLSAGGVVAARKRARVVAQPQLAEIDAIAQRLLGLGPPPSGAGEDVGESADEDEITGGK